MMHTLIAGVTGSGKSYTEHLLINNLLGSKIYLDPKRVELRKYRNNTDCVRYAADIEDCIDALRDACDEMENRYLAMEFDNESEYSGLPLYVIVDEAAALMDTGSSKKEATQLLYNLAFLGRAAKVYLILCTQRCTADVIPRKISVNMENKICLRQQKPIDSRELIGIPDASRLPKIGYCYLLTPDMRRAERMTPQEAVERVIKA